MKKLPTVMFVALLMVGCEQSDEAVQEEASPEEKRKRAEEEAKRIAESIGLHDYKIIAEAIDFDPRNRVPDYRQHDAGRPCPVYHVIADGIYVPYTGWVKDMHNNGQIRSLAQYKDGKYDGPKTTWWSNGQKRTEGTKKHDLWDGPLTSWYRNGQKSSEATYKNGKLPTAVTWRPNGKKCPHTNVVNGDGVYVWYNDDGTEKTRMALKDGDGIGVEKVGDRFWWNPQGFRILD